MSSVVRSLKQTPSNFFWSHGAYIYTLDYIKAWFKGEGSSTYTGPEPTYSGSLILFDTEENLSNATYDLLYYDANYSYYAESYTTHLDMGKNIYIGVVGGESRMLTMSLIKIQASNSSEIGKTGFGLTAMNLPLPIAVDWDGDVDVDLFRAGI